MNFPVRYNTKHIFKKSFWNIIIVIFLQLLLYHIRLGA